MAGWHLRIAFALSLAAHGGAAMLIYGSGYSARFNESIVIGEVEYILASSVSGNTNAPQISPEGDSQESKDAADKTLSEKIAVYRIIPSGKKKALREPVTPEATAGHVHSGVPTRASRVGTELTYEVLLARALEEAKRYPRRALERGIEGEALLRLSLSLQGEVVESAVVRSTGNTVLDAEVLALVQRAAPFPPLPNEFQEKSVAFNVPITFRLR